jgi:NTE family protein
MSEPRERRVAIACQGGGSHTAFTAGVLSRLLTADELRRYRVVGLSGTSGGAICALLAWSALRSGDRERAAGLLGEFWDDNSARSPLDRLLNLWMVSAGVLQNLGVLPGLSPYAIPEPLSGMDQFRALLARHVDFDAIQADPDGTDPMLLLGAVDVISGRFRAFNSRQDRITADSVIASAAIPNLFRAVHTDGGVYWDGLFSQNPPVRDLLAVDPDELWVIQINPQTIDHEPRTLTEISDRRNELAGNLSLYQELGFIETIDRLLEEGSLSKDGPYKHVSVRVIELPRSALPAQLGPASKLNRDPAFLRGLVERGREQADRFLGALAFERAWAARDADAVLGLATPGATLVSEAPFPGWDGANRDPVRLREFVTTMLDQDIRIDSTRKQIAQDHVVWTIRMRNSAARAAVEGVAEASFTGARISGLRLGPRRGPAR